MEIRQITDDGEKQNITRLILEALPDWFGIPEAREEYIAESNHKIFFCAFEGDSPVGFLYLKETGSATVELYVMGVLKEFHRKGIGRELFSRAKEAAVEQGYLFRSKQSKWGNMRNMTGQTSSTFRLALRNLRCFPHYGMNGIHVRYILWV